MIKGNKKHKKKRGQTLNKEIIGIVIISIGLLSLVSMHSESAGVIGKSIENRLREIFGFGGYIVPYIILSIGVLFTLNKLKLHETKRSISLVLIFISYLTILHIPFINKLSPLTDDLSFWGLIKLSIQAGKEAQGGGAIGGATSFILLKLFGVTGSYIVVFSLMLITFLVLTNTSIIKILNKIYLFILKILGNSFIAIKDFIVLDKKNASIPEQSESRINILDVQENNFAGKPVLEENDDQINEKIRVLDFTKNDGFVKESKTNNTDKEVHKNEDPANTTLSSGNQNISNIECYKIPNTDLLERYDKKSTSHDKRDILENAQKLEETLNNFGIEAKVIQINKGPTITRYELQPAPGVKVSRIVNLSDDIALSLAASDVRIEAPIPGKAAIGIEVPNKHKTNVGLKDIVDSKEYSEIDTKLPFALGKDIGGKSIITSIEKMPHLLIAGATGSGKSVCINTLILSILFKANPNDVKMLMIDPKVVELSVYNGIPHLLIPVVTDPKKASGALSWAVQEMTDRYNKFAQNGVRDIYSYNNKAIGNDKINKLPQIVIIIDELADLMMVAPTEVEDSICRLAQMARAAGIHLIVATQRPSVDIVTGTIKANIPSRISFSVSSQVDSRTILDMAGAEKLLGKGDMLFYPVGASKPLRVQGAYVDEKEVEKVVSFIKNTCESEYEQEIINDIEKEVSFDVDEQSDDLLPDAITLVVDEGQASISFLQRKLKIGYARAARLIDQMEERGIVGGYEGSKPRKVLVTKEDLE